MNRIEEAQFAWKAWNLLSDLTTFIWERYEKHFLDFIIEEQQEKPMPEPLPQDDLFYNP